MGRLEGRDVGRLDGLIVGWILFLEGNLVACLEGIADGLSVLFFDGEKDGLRDGHFVGFEDLLIDGAEVGLLVGAIGEPT